jgi:hypothetical protein
MSWKRVGIVASLWGATLGAADRTAATILELPLQAIRPIASESDEARVLLDPGDLSVLDGELVVSAFLELSLPPVATERDVELRVGSVTTDWEGETPTWTHPWSRPGGDVDTKYAHTVALGRTNASGRLLVDVTQILQEIADGRAGKHGFMLTASARRVGFSPEEMSRLGSLSGTILRVDYRQISTFGISRRDR